MGKVRQKTIPVKGMFCRNCAIRIQMKLLSLPGVKSASASFEKENVSVVYDEASVTPETLKQAMESLGYEIPTERESGMQIISILIILLAIYLIARHLGWTDVFNVFPSIETSFSLGMLFVIGLLTSVHCIAMCGGINLAQSAAAAKDSRSLAKTNLAYNAGRVVSYTITGALVGGLGSVISFSGTLRGVVAIAAGMIMILVGLSMLGIGKRIRAWRFPVQDGIYKRVSRLFHGKSSFFIGLLNGLMPCGPLQSMQIYALATGSVAMGAISMLMFSLGTVPVMLGFGLLSGGLNRKYVKYMLTVSALLVFVMGIHMMGNGLSLSGFSISPVNARDSIPMAAADKDIQRITTEVDYGSYEPLMVRNGIPVEWTVVVPEGKLNGCNGEIIVPAYELDIKLHEGENRIEFTPDGTGTVPYSCWMGMIKSYIAVID